MIEHLYAMLLCADLGESDFRMRLALYVRSSALFSSLDRDPTVSRCETCQDDLAFVL